MMTMTQKRLLEQFVHEETSTLARLIMAKTAGAQNVREYPQENQELLFYAYWFLEKVREEEALSMWPDKRHPQWAVEAKQEQEGIAKGRAWAADVEDDTKVRNLDGVWRMNLRQTDPTEAELDNGPSPFLFESGTIAWWLSGDSDIDSDSQTTADWWIRNAGAHDPSRPFVRGFVRGALRVWVEANKLAMPPRL